MIKRPYSHYLESIKSESNAVRYDLAGTTPPDPGLIFDSVDVAESVRAGHLASVCRTLAEMTGWAESGIQITPGASQAVLQTMAALTQAGEAVVIENPTYEPILAAAEFLNLKIMSFERTGDFARDVANLRALEGTAKILVITNPNCPTGHSYTADQLAELARMFSHLIVDETYLPSFEKSFAKLRPGDGFSIGGLSKSLGLSGLRLGWVMHPPHAGPAIRSVGRLLHVDMPTPSLQFGAQALRRAPLILERLCNIARANYEILRSSSVLRPALVDYSSGRGSFYCLRIPSYAKDAETFAAHLELRHSVRVRSGHFFGLERRIRVSALVPAEDFAEAATRIASAYVD